AIVISPPDAFPDEQKIVTRLFDAGLSRFHLRKPEWTPARLREWVGALPRRHHAKLVVHAQPAVVSELRLGGLHLRTGQPHPGNWPQDIPVSQSCHSFGELTIYARHRAYAMLGPVFPSISKRDYTPQRTPEEYAVIINQWRTEVGTCPLLALGGLTPENIPRARALGFDGFAVVGSVWEADDPVEGFKRLRDAWTRK
ncbi:MAG: thiamine phosphate synthase, partial [Puniceicoccales bacterium]|nr:thiamine phosphate synthase [Puniceicoccales bacterium]